MRETKKENLLRLIQVLFFPLSIIYMELVLSVYCKSGMTFHGAVYTMLFSCVIGILCYLVSSIGTYKAKRIISIVLMVAITIVFGVQAVYYTIFRTYTTLFSVLHGGGDALTEFGTEALAGIWHTIIPLILLLLPLVAVILFRRLVSREKPNLKGCIVLLMFAAALHFGVVAVISLDNGGVMSYNYVYNDVFSPQLSVPRFGILTTMRLDAQNMLFGGNGNADADVNSGMDAAVTDPSVEGEGEQGEEDPQKPTPVSYDMNIMEIDFDELIANETDSTLLDMHEYFKNCKGTQQNEYTGMFKDYNLIWIVAEGFSSWAIDRTHTPTLYKLSHEGFVFKNFYNPIWGVSTSDGEYTTTTGLIPKSGVWSYSRSADNYMPFGFGHMFSALGYECRAYHNHTYSYYDRDKSHPNMGYDYKGLGSGLDVTEVWPESDVEMMEKTIPEYVDDAHFMTYYMTVSGHLNYSFIGNSMSYKHKEDVADLDYSEACRAYIACQMEFDQSVEYLINALEEKGVLDKTVIVISGDHYPYGLTIDEIEELNGGDVEENFELYRSTLMIWNSKMKTVAVDKYCSALDVMPTLANLFGLKYDSRLIMGQDIFSTAPALVMFSNRSYITPYGRYNSTTDTFTENEGVSVGAGYARSILQQVNDKFSYSAKILDNDYYKVVLGQN